LKLCYFPHPQKQIKKFHLVTGFAGVAGDNTCNGAPGELKRGQKKCILYNLDAVLRDVKTRQAYAK
jgi:hypothetical protein